MKLKTSLIGLAAACTLMAGCIQDEALNVEAAIDACTGSDIQQAIIDPDHFKVQLYVSRAVDLQRVNINFALPEGATIAPLNATGQQEATGGYYNFQDENPRKFKVTSEDGAHAATYDITVWQTEMPTSYHFETLSSTTPYHVFYEQESAEGTPGQHVVRRLEWASGNPGYQLTAQAKTADDYPTVQILNGGVNGGSYVKLETKGTGSFGEMVHMPIAAGNLFIGSFDRTNAVNDPMAATHFGFPFFDTPVRLEGYYRFRRGDVFSSDGEPVPDKQDECDIYGVLYETDANVQFLDGETSLTSPNIVSLARMPQGTYLEETDQWTYFSFPFELQNGKAIDADKLRTGGYKLAVVFSSSVGGAKFNGAIGSILCVDEVKLTVTTANN